MKYYEDGRAPVFDLSPVIAVRTSEQETSEKHDGNCHVFFERNDRASTLKQILYSPKMVTVRPMSGPA